ncbi:MAG: hypothetical protein BV457_02170 [Thermoplasmata archaeon M9B1D]|nr:MAG: hypothetical protein BV457_02170 [Thermoplasmata archaeon M9B1D]PNX50115.1 MAG: hypothetical protein BV456_07780 [Thermoplasmata archaeon M8B2D]
MGKNAITKEIKDQLINTFEEVKDIVRKSEKRSRAGLMLGLQELGSTLNGFIGAYFPISSNIIIINKTPLRRIIETNPNLIKPYGFHLLLHEYIHSLGFLDEQITRQKTYEISRQYFGDKHIITQLSTNINKFFPNLVYPINGWIPTKNIPLIEIIQGFDKTNTENYIS